MVTGAATEKGALDDQLAIVANKLLARNTAKENWDNRD